MNGLVAVGLHRRFGRRVAVHDLSLRVDPGEVVGLLGPNGAGKTTVFRMLTGLLRPHGGEVRVGGVDVTQWPLWRRARAGLGYLPQRATVFRRLTVAENITVGLDQGDASERKPGPRLQALVDAFGVGHLSDARGATLSGGERRLVEIARALAARPRILLVDEPFAALDPKAGKVVSQHLRRLATEGVGVLLTDHDAQQTLVACDRAYILNRGELLLEGTPREVATDRRARDAWLGEDFSPRGSPEGTAWRST